jgi:D-3-phosphoglycerate dehydrogenase / 2-oxoglutarate reductase
MASQPEGPRFRVVVTDQVFPDVDTERELLATVGAELEVASGDRDEVLEQARDADALLNTYMPIDAEAVAALKRCRIIARYGIGVDNVDLDAARQAGIVVTNVPDYCVEEVATHALGLILALVRKIPQGDALVRAGGWGVERLRPVTRLSELTTGLVGFGRIARRLARVLDAMDARVIVHDPYITPDADGRTPDGRPLVELEELLATADVVSVHCPLTPATRGLIDAAALARMRPSAVLVNTSRGPIVKLADLLEALRGERLAGAALDVLEQEPPDAAVLREVPNLLVTPHAAFYSEAAVRESQRKAATQIIRVLTGLQPDYQVN